MQFVALAIIVVGFLIEAFPWGKFFGYLIPVVGIGLFIYAVRDIRRGTKAAEAAQAQREEQKKRAEETKKSNQRALANRIASIVACSKEAAGALPKLMRSAECSLDQAEHEFADGAFAPFWDAIEQAANHMARFDQTVRLIDCKANEYKSQSSNLASEPPLFELGLQVLPDPTRTAHRMKAIVRCAQKDFHFATIYEQRKTNQLLVEGFNNLGDALNGITDRLESSLDSLASSVTTAITGVATAQTKATSDFLAELKVNRRHNEQDAKARRDHERKVEERLDNIQRKRKPVTW